ncbi:MAG: hypothetical protein J6Y47_06200 [Bacteroidales bacterium]|nr:hypothetical protein [Bacteroidales bacterium]
MGEDKQYILNLLLKAIQATRAGNDVTGLEFNPKTEIVNVYFGGSGFPSRTINVAMDSGIAVLKDVINHIDIG